MRISGPFAPTAVAVLLLSHTSACAPKRSDVGPDATLSAFSRALERGDAQTAYDLMSEAYRDRVSFEAFQASLAHNVEERQALAKALEKRAERNAYVTVRLSDGRQVRLERRGDRYFIDTPIADFYSQATPKDALESFIRAVERSRWDVLYELMPEADRAGIDVETLGKNLEAQIEELTRIVSLLKTSRELPIEVVGDRATMPYGESFTVRFVREDGRWKIEDPE